MVRKNDRHPSNPRYHMSPLTMTQDSCPVVPFPYIATACKTLCVSFQMVRSKGRTMEKIQFWVPTRSGPWPIAVLRLIVGCIDVIGPVLDGPLNTLVMKSPPSLAN